MIVVDPNRIAGPVDLDDSLSEAFVDLLESAPALRPYGQLLYQIVKHWPENAIRYFLIEVTHLRGSQINRNDALLSKRFLEVLPLAAGEPGQSSRPAKPNAARFLMRSDEAGDQAAAGSLEAKLALLDMGRYWKSIRNEE